MCKHVQNVLFFTFAPSLQPTRHGGIISSLFSFSPCASSFADISADFPSFLAITTLTGSPEAYAIAAFSSIRLGALLPCSSLSPGLDIVSMQLCFSERIVHPALAIVSGTITDSDSPIR
jgi:hypothetical protein